MGKVRIVLCVAVAFGAGSESLGAREARHPHRVPAAPSADAVELDVLAPPSRASTAFQTYGDAAVARARYQRLAAPAEPGETYPYVCDPRRAATAGYVCDNDPAQVGYGRLYAYTPAYLGAPQVVARTPGPQHELLNPLTGLFFAADSLRLDPHN